MYFDSERNAYIDRDTGEVVFQEPDEVTVDITENDLQTLRSNRSRTNSRRTTTASSPSNSLTNTRKAVENYLFPKPSAPVSTARDSTSFYSRRFGTPRSTHIPPSESAELELSQISVTGDHNVILDGEDQKTNMAEELYQIHMNNSYDLVAPQENEQQANSHGWDDWTLARALQALEFEIPEETNPYEDFNNKEYSASRSCRRQLMTVSFFICVLQVGVLIAMFEKDGTAPESENPSIGPPIYSLVRFGAKESALIVDRNEYWRLVTSIMLHAGIIHIIPNVLIQLRIGGYLNLVYGTWKWLWIYFSSGIFGEIMSCCFIPNAVGVGSSGALMGLLASWVVWIIIRWSKIPPECRTQRNCQLFTVIAAIVVTLATSFMPAVDFSAHFGGAFQGLLWGIVLLGSEMGDGHQQNALRYVAGVIALSSYAYAIYYLVVDLKPSTSSLSEWSANDDWN